MKKIFRIALVLVFSVTVFSSCTKEEVKPQITSSTGTGLKE